MVMGNAPVAQKADYTGRQNNDKLMQLFFLRQKGRGRTERPVLQLIFLAKTAGAQVG
jgi:hypothetical protein